METCWRCQGVSQLIRGASFPPSVWPGYFEALVLGHRATAPEMGAPGVLFGDMDAGAGACGGGEGQKGQLRPLQPFPEQGVADPLRPQEVCPLHSRFWEQGTEPSVSLSYGVSLFSESEVQNKGSQSPLVPHLRSARCS